MRDYYLHLYDTSGRQITHGALRISAGNDFEAVAKTARHSPSDVYRAFLIDGLRIVAEWPGQKGGLVKAAAD
jgi:hypothetical protein